MCQDMMDGLIPVDEPIKIPECLYLELYTDLPEFEDFPYCRLVSSRIKSLQITVKRLQDSAQQADIAALAHDRAIYPGNLTHSTTGRKNWRGSEADK
jgi:hypothetical protein